MRVMINAGESVPQTYKFSVFYFKFANSFIKNEANGQNLEGIMKETSVVYLKCKCNQDVKSVAV